MIKKIFILIFHLIVLTSCNKKNMGRQPQNLRTNFCISPHSFHPNRAVDSADATICKALYEGLTRINLKGEVELALAEKVKISSCKKKYTFILKNTVWSNGQKVKAQHFTSAWQAALTRKDLLPKRLLIIKNSQKIYEKKLPVSDLGVQALNDQTIVIELEHPAPYFLQLLSEPAYSPVFDANKEEPVVFNGPFNVKNFEIEKKLTLKANPLYWDAQSVRLNEIQISFINDGNTIFSMYEDKELDWLATPFNEFPFEILQSNPNIKVLKTTSPFWVYLNTENKNLKSANIRKALSYAIDRSEIVQRVIPYHTELYTIIPTSLSSLDKEKFVKECNLKNAKDLFEKGLRELNLQRENFSLTLNHSNYSDHERLAVYLKDCWEKAFKIRINLRKDNWKAFAAKLRSQDYEIGGCYVCNLYDHPTYLLERFEGGYTSKWFEASFRDFMNQARLSKEEAEQSKYLKKAETILLEGMPVIPIYNQSNVFLCRDNLKNVFPPKFMYTDFKWAYFEE